MKLFDFFKKTQEEPVVKTSFEQSRKNIEERFVKEKKNLDSIIEQIKKKINEFSDSLEKEMGILKKIDLEDKREHKKIKLLTMQGLESYIVELERLVKNLRDVSFVNSLSKYFGDFDKIISDFSKSSHSKRERATILIGKEIVSVEELIKKSYKEVEEIFGVNKGTANFLKKYSELKNLEKMSVEEGNKISDSEKNLSKLKSAGNNLIGEEDATRKAILEYEDGEEYKRWLEDKTKMEKEISELKNSVLELKEKIDLKGLMKKNYSVEKNRRIINNYRDNFFRAFEEDRGNNFSGVLESSGMENVGKELKKIYSRNSELKECLENFENKKMIKLSKKLNENEKRIKEVYSEIKFGEERLEKIKNKKNEINEEIKKLVGDLSD